MNGREESWSLAATESIWQREDTGSKQTRKLPLLVLLRIRNEELILQDTLDHLAGFADVICAYDDASTDATRAILKAHEKVAMIVQNDEWQSSIDSRLLSETRHRGLLLQEARKRFDFDWCMCCDADERYVGPIREFVTAPIAAQVNGVRIRLFDAYMTKNDDHPFEKGMKLLNFRRYFGPERRDILMLWKNREDVKFVGLDAREPIVATGVETDFYCQHYGKSLSYAHWEATCDYYVKHFPWDPYGQKWNARKGKALHEQSDFGTALHAWGSDLFDAAVKIY